MLKHLISISALVVVASGACFDNGDKEIGGACYKFVAQKLSFADARNWCHYQNPVTASYLASVSNQFTANFLASYARSAFGQNDGYFWIGLSRNKTYTPWTWDTGYQMQWSNFDSDQLSYNYAAENIVNSKWRTFAAEEQMNFVCSYDPTSPPTFAPPTSDGPSTPTPTPTAPQTTTQTVPTTTDPDDYCVPGQNTTFLFAYSNDFDRWVIDGMRQMITRDFGLYIVYKRFAMASVRFDLKQPEEILFYDSVASFDTSIVAHYPNPKLGFQDDTTGSDVTSVLRRFLEHRPICGATVLLALKRNTNETDLSDIIEKLQERHIYVYSLGSSQVLGPIGDSNPMYDVSTESNGMFIYANETAFKLITRDYVMLFNGYPCYVFNAAVAGNGTLDMPLFHKCPTSTSVTLAVVYQDTPLDGGFQSLSLTFDIGHLSSKQYNVTVYEGEGTSWWYGIFLDGSMDHTLKMDYSYATNTAVAVEVVVYTQTVVSNWPPYNM